VVDAAGYGTNGKWSLIYLQIRLLALEKGSGIK